ncbi:hypothetical protein UFOVP273_47 [uncultured Caudovirales phage]|uniref:Uncharacterized protein n=1 Tax=uncultured Caudovirales phage TaxID=2100421 RepID=A0A6J5LLW3_9CAUD|nr:hypothetical protein UFOVP273_47 [uncultured Caudovirales phage]
MKLHTFTYTKAGGATSTRTVVEVSTPTEFLSGLDVTDEAPSRIAGFAEKHNAITDEMNKKFLALQEEYGFTKFRQFKSVGIDDHEIKWL